MKIVRFHISNWKSFRHSATPIWIPSQQSEFGQVNVLIGENSAGKSNVGNAIRLALSESGTDYGGFPRRIRKCDFNDMTKEIAIDVNVLDDQGKPLSLPVRIPPLDRIPECAFPDIDDRVRGRFLGVGPKRLLGNLGEHVATTRRSDKAKNFELIQNEWVSIREAAQKHFGIDLAKSPPAQAAKGSLYLEATPDENGAPLLETGSGKVEALYFIVEVLKLAGTYSVFLFEEPETHMHPRLQRMFLGFLVDIATEKNLQFFITTHSAAFVDRSISSAQDIKVFQVQCDEGGGTCVKEIAKTDAEALRHLLLDALGYRASDVLQANGIVWVEGPSDRIYIRKWLELLCSKRRLSPFIEGVHYLVLPYGGNVETHDFFADEQRTEHMIRTAELNANRFVVIDRDKGKGERWANKQRVISALTADLTWVTHERALINGNSTIEGYLSTDQRERFEKLEKPRKTKFALQATKNMTAAIFDSDLELEESVSKLYEAIKSWNHIQ